MEAVASSRQNNAVSEKQAGSLKQEEKLGANNEKAAQGAPPRRGPQGPRMVLRDVVPQALQVTATTWLTPPQLSEAVSGMLDRTYQSLQPSAQHYNMRVQLLQRLNEIVQPIAPGSEVIIFGSFETNVYTPAGDLDLSIVLPETGFVRYEREEVQLRGGSVTKPQRVKILRMVKKLFLFQRGAFSQMELVAQARVPVLNFVDNLTRVHCDMSINNDGALFKSRVLRWMLELDNRARPLIYLVKAWARAANINDSRNGTLNSYAISLMVVFHLQTCSPPVLPPFSRILGSDYHEIMEDIGVSGMRVTEAGLRMCHSRVQHEQAQQRPQNGSSLADLLASFFFQYAGVESLWPVGLTVCPWSGTWKEARETHSSWHGKQYIMRVEDPFDVTENCARSVQPGRMGFQRVCAAFRDAALRFRNPPQVEALHQALFGVHLPPPQRNGFHPNRGNLKAGDREGVDWRGARMGGHVINGRSHVAPPRPFVSHMRGPPPNHASVQQHPNPQPFPPGFRPPPPGMMVRMSAPSQQTPHNHHPFSQPPTQGSSAFPQYPPVHSGQAAPPLLQNPYRPPLLPHPPPTYRPPVVLPHPPSSEHEPP